MVIQPDYLAQSDPLSASGGNNQTTTNGPRSDPGINSDPCGPEVSMHELRGEDLSNNNSDIYREDSNQGGHPSATTDKNNDVTMDMSQGEGPRILGFSDGLLSEGDGGDSNGSSFLPVNLSANSTNSSPPSGTPTNGSQVLPAVTTRVTGAARRKSQSPVINLSGSQGNLTLSLATLHKQQSVVKEEPVESHSNTTNSLTTEEINRKLSASHIPSFVPFDEQALRAKWLQNIAAHVQGSTQAEIPAPAHSVSTVFLQDTIILALTALQILVLIGGYCGP